VCPEARRWISIACPSTGSSFGRVRHPQSTTAAAGHSHLVGTRIRRGYTWKRSGKVIKAAHGKKYRLKSTDRGRNIKVTVTASRSGYKSGTATTKAKHIKKKVTKHKTHRWR
jgi:hypothetical protein